MKKLLVILLSTMAITNSVLGKFKVVNEDRTKLATCSIIAAGPLCVKAHVEFYQAAERVFATEDREEHFRYEKIDSRYFFIEKDEIESPIYCLRSMEEFPTRSYYIDGETISPGTRRANWRLLEAPRDPHVYKSKIENTIIHALAKAMRHEARSARKKHLAK